MNWSRISGIWVGFWVGLLAGFGAYSWLTEVRGASSLQIRLGYQAIAIPIGLMLAMFPDAIVGTAKAVRRYRAAASSASRSNVR